MSSSPLDHRPSVKHVDSLPPSAYNPRPSVIAQRTDSSGRIYPHSMARAASGRSHIGPSNLSRPDAPRRTTSVQTQYMNMLLALDAVPRGHNIIASFFTWILLAGFVILPGTFTSLEQIEGANSVENLALHAVQNIPLCVSSSLLVMFLGASFETSCPGSSSRMFVARLG